MGDVKKIDTLIITDEQRKIFNQGSNPGSPGFPVQWKDINVENVNLDFEQESLGNFKENGAVGGADKDIANSEPASIAVPAEANNYNECYTNFLSGKIASNMYDAANGKFIESVKMNDQYWLDKKLLFDKASNGTYLISVLDDNGNKVAMGYINEETYNEYQANYVKWTGGGRDEYGKYSSSTYGNGNIQKVYEDGTTRWFDAKGEPIADPTVETYKGIGDLRREEYSNKEVSNNNVSTESSDEGGYKGIGDLRREEYSNKEISDNNVSTESGDEGGYKGIGDLRREEYSNKEVSDNNVSAKSSDEGGYKGIGDLRREEYSNQNVSNNNTSTESSVNYSNRYSGSSIDSRSGNFNLTADNNKFTMTDADKAKVAAIIYGEAVEGSPDDALAVASVMANRVDAGNWGGSEEGILGVATAANQFVAYGGNKYNKFMAAYQNGTLSEGMKICLDAVNDVTKGIRNNSYKSFTGNGVYNKYK